MKPARNPSDLPHSDVWEAWQHEVRSQRDQDLAIDLRQRAGALFPRFSDYYGRLHALPRRWRRAIGRRLRQSLAGVALLLALGQGDAFAATINVDGTLCTLADAITAANTDAAVGGCPGGSGADTLVLAAGSTTTLTAVDNEIYGPNGLPAISSEITIEGNGSTIERSTVPGTPEFRVMSVERDGDLTLRNTTITHGIAKRSTFPSGNGGGIYSRGNLTISQSTISGNSAWSDGGGVFGHTFHVSDSTIHGNNAGGNGGGISADYFGRPKTVKQTTVSSNTASQGAGISVVGTEMVIKNSTISGNVASQRGGGIFVSFTATPPRDYFKTGSAYVRETVVSGNLSVQGAELSTLSYDVYRGSIVSDGHNLVADGGKSNSEAFDEFLLGDIAFGNSDIIATSDGTHPTALEDILEPTLGFNGGPTQTHALVEGSPAVDAAGVDCPPPVTDQRGIARAQGAACDIGAFEGTVGNVNNLVTFVPDPGSYETTTDVVGCPDSYRGKFLLEAALSNVSGLDLNSLSTNIDALTGRNLVLAPNGELLGEGDKLAVPREGDYADGTLSPGETVQAPFEICLKRLRSFRFFVDVFGQRLDRVISFFEGFDDDFIAGRSVPDGVDANRSTSFSDINEPRPTASGLLSLRDRAVESGSTGLGGGFPPRDNAGFGAILDFTDGRGSFVTVPLPVPAGSTVAAGSFLKFEVAAFGDDGGALKKFFSTDGINFTSVGNDSDANGIHRFDLPMGASDVFFRLQVGDRSIFDGIWIDNIRAVIRLN